MSEWYAVHTKARHRRGRWREVTEPLFPGYVFTHLDLHSDNIAPIRSARSAAGLARFDSRHIPVPEVLIDNLITIQDDTDGIICTGTL